MTIQYDIVDEVEVIERYILLLLGVIDKSIPSLIHLEKELFILSRVNPLISTFLVFEKHYYGPYSDDVRELIVHPSYYSGAIEYVNNKIHLTEKGRKDYKSLMEDYSDNSKFKEFIALMKKTREIYEKLSVEELLFLIYLTYPEYREASEVSDKLLLKNKRKEISSRLLKKGMITEERLKEAFSYA